MRLNKPFIKWPGGKSNVLHKLFRHVPRKGNILVEPFVGAASFCLNTDYRHYILADINPDLINMYRMVTANPGRFIRDSRDFFDSTPITEQSYYDVRDRFNGESDPQRRSIMFHWLTKRGYNGLVRYNLSGTFNVPFGQYKTQPVVEEPEIMFFAEKFKQAVFLCMSFEDVLKKYTPRGATIFADPPYIPKSKTASFTQYAPVPFKIEDHEKLDLLCHENSRAGCAGYVCNHDVPITKETYRLASGASRYYARRSIAHTGDRKQAKEILLKYEPC